MPIVQGVRIRIEGQAGYITLDRPEKANAYTDQMLVSIENALESMSNDPSIRAVVFEGSGGRFCSGADTDQIRVRGAKDALDLASDRVFDRIDSCTKPTIAVIDGPAVAGGFELALSCDLRIASTRARFSLPETSIGILPAAGALRRLPRIAGESITKQMVLFGKILPADEAYRAGLIVEITDPQSLSEKVETWIQAVISRDFVASKLAKNAIHMTRNDIAAKQFIANAQGVLYDLKKG